MINIKEFYKLICFFVSKEIGCPEHPRVGFYTGVVADTIEIVYKSGLIGSRPVPMNFEDARILWAMHLLMWYLGREETPIHGLVQVVDTDKFCGLTTYQKGDININRGDEILETIFAAIKVEKGMVSDN